jgi:flagellar biogenesis protein FliO
MSRTGCYCLLLSLLLSTSLIRAEPRGQTSAMPAATASSDPLDRPLVLGQNDPARKSEEHKRESAPPGLAMSTIVGGLAICLGIFLLVVVLTRRNTQHKFGPLPTEVVESLGRMTLNHRQQLQLIRLGQKLILLSVTPQGANPVAEIDNPDEVTRLAGLCQQDRPNSATATFREVLGKYGQEPDAADHYDRQQAVADTRATLARSRRPTREGFHG